MDNKKDKKIIFSEEIDKKIGGLALAFTFVSLGLLLLFVDNFLGNEIANEILRWIYIAIGGLGLISEVRIKDTSVKGTGQILAGVVITIPFVVFYINFDLWLLNLILFLLGTVGVFAIFSGMLQMIYSMRILLREKKAGRASLDLTLLLTRIFALFLVVAQVVQFFAER